MSDGDFTGGIEYRPDTRRYTDTTFDAGEEVAEIVMYDETITGPFCTHCGWWETTHRTEDAACPVPPSPYVTSEQSVTE
jgi:hypothetical protein